MKLTYTLKPGFAGPRAEWPARDHDEPSKKIAEEKIESGFYRAAGKSPAPSRKPEVPLSPPPPSPKPTHWEPGEKGKPKLVEG